MILTPEMIEAAAVAMANFDVSLVGCPILQSIDEFRFDKDRDEYLRRAKVVLEAAITAWNTRAGETA
ncbi:hypothetical protein [Acetobacter orleanensis]|uniref:Uncharacterized protein n=1 Tax=Acetobacter orleanensis TaxID=104099 RepID=A0A4Y3TQ35_9PROT|nr:hypothetical protein [Acetobacter orleanensis]KXV62564.1 hypothetical protein AD949_10675 [Acetobacter orleanensis]PCD79989.1 hypothetical protein CO710_03795 [Acetobacter orleanensis]GAN68302.1 hypothetical protein Abol_015_141 [Acetobacter orleanensis JCM 7639]GBR27577.1 hypothetical protein AA0473_1476 [Acetobacter orleanensis NRIC 0473]GEB83884.1 hypothetical protein AOR01nite_23610 [Acetobacter orleanensis]